MNAKLTSVALECSNDFDNEIRGASGILISDDFIMSHGSLLDSRVTSNPRICEFFENITIGELKSLPLRMREDIKIRVYQQRTNDGVTSNGDKNDNRALEKNLPLRLVSSAEYCDPEINDNEGILLMAWKCPLLENTFRQFFYSWRFEKVSRANERILLPIFLIILLKSKNTLERHCPDEQVSRVRRVLDSLIDDCGNDLRKPARSSNVEISSTPFGNPVFIDSLSRGIVSNVFGDDGCVMLTDANAVPGSEGAPVYATGSDGTRSYICGMVIAPLSWCRGEWVDYTFAASLLPCLRRLLRYGSVNQQLVDQSETRIADSLDKSLVLVKCGNGWGTGIIFDARTGTIITCSHVVNKAPESRIKVVLRRGDDSQSSGSSSSASSWAKLVYRTAKGEPYDVAVLRLDTREIEPTLRSIKIADDRPVLRGETVGSAGFPFFASRFSTITRGNVSGITESMLRTTCCVQSGSSGGPIVRWSNGEMLGMVVCNAIAINDTKIYPRLNMAVPVSILVPPISEYLRTGDVKALDALGSKDPNVRREWNFYRLPSSKI